MNDVEQSIRVVDKNPHSFLLSNKIPGITKIDHEAQI